MQKFVKMDEWMFEIFHVKTTQLTVTIHGTYVDS